MIKIQIAKFTTYLSENEKQNKNCVNNTFSQFQRLCTSVQKCFGEQSQKLFRFFYIFKALLPKKVWEMSQISTTGATLLGKRL